MGWFDQLFSRRGVPATPGLDGIFHDFARAFRGAAKGDSEIAFPELLRRDRLDGSLDSLREVDTYLGQLHDRQGTLEAAAAEITVLWGGAYVGEVIRLNAPSGAFHWVDYKDYVPHAPKLAAALGPRDVQTCAFLVSSSGGMTMPLNKIARFLGDGPEHSVYSFAQITMQSQNSRSAS
jgi:hypothetical protein